MKKIRRPINILLSIIMVVSLFWIVPFTVSATVVTDDDFTVSGDGTAYRISAQHLPIIPAN